MSEYINLAVPFFSQRENVYTWYQYAKETVFYKDNPEKIQYNVESYRHKEF